jgi:hypothetical protein
MTFFFLEILAIPIAIELVIRFFFQKLGLLWSLLIGLVLFFAISLLLCILTGPLEHLYLN